MLLGVPGEHSVAPDLVFSLRIDPPRPLKIAAPRRVVGINPMPVFDDSYWPERDPRAYEHYRHTLAAFAGWLVRSGYDVRFFGTQLLVDQGVIDGVRGLMRLSDADDAERIVADRIHSMDELMTVIDGLDLVVATRYHGTVFSLIRHKPVISIAYHPKSLELMEQIGLAEYAIEFGRITMDVLRNRFLALERRDGEVVETLRQRLPELRRALERQYERMLPSPQRGFPGAVPVLSGGVQSLQQRSSSRAPS
jgi:polysaccharide pyruvyl transferase WcaK-like protein